MKTKIPNLNTISTVIDRLIIETVKQELFQLRLEDTSDEAAKCELELKIESQNELRKLIREELQSDLEDILEKKKYTFLGENRTFN